MAFSTVKKVMRITHAIEPPGPGEALNLPDSSVAIFQSFSASSWSRIGVNEKKLAKTPQSMYP